MEKEFKPDFFVIPRAVFEDPDIQPLDCMVYAVIYWFHSMKDGVCFASNPTIARVLNASPRGVQNSLTALENHGFIKRIQGSNGRQIIPMATFRLPQSSNGDANFASPSPALSPIEDSNYHQLRTLLSPIEDQNYISNNNIITRRRDRPPHADIAYLSNIPKEDMDKILSRVVASMDQVESKAEDLLLWCQTNGKRKKNYYTFLLNAVKRDFPPKVAINGKYKDL